MMTRIAILGAGPVGLEAALAARAAGHRATVYEQAPTPAGNVRAWGHVRLFTPWDWNVSPRMRAALGDAAPAGNGFPTGDELAGRLLDPVARSLDVRTGVRVLGVARRGCSSTRRSARRHAPRGPSGCT